MKVEWHRHWPLAAALVVLWATIAALLVLGLERTGGRLVYALDDTYIHMAIAKHLARDGVWGVTPYAFGSSSSSPLWTALLAIAHWILGPNEAVPLVLNVVFASICLGAISSRLRDRLGAWRSFATLIALIALTPLPVIVFCGMEHALHILLMVWFVFGAAALPEMERNPSPRRSMPFSMLVLAGLLPLVRYESLFAILVVAALLTARRHHRDAIALVSSALIPVALYGGYSIWHGWFALPNSVLVKGTPGGALEAPWRVPSQLLKSSPLAALIGISFALLATDWLRGRRQWARGDVLPGVFLAVSLIHLQLASVGSHYRHEAYLMVLGILGVAWRLFPAGELEAEPVPGATRRRVLQAIRIAVVVLGVAAAWRRGVAFERTPIAMQNIYQQQYVMGLFLARGYSGQPVAANDIGAINYLADLRCLDLMGIASMPIARLRLEGRRKAAEVDRVVRESGARIAVVYESWFGNQYVTEDRIPERWGVPLARWVIADNVVCGGDTVSFFALDPSEREALAAHLQAFTPLAPNQVIQSGQPAIAGIILDRRDSP